MNFVAPDVLYSYDQSTTGYELSRIQLLPGGAIFVNKTNPFSGFGTEIRADSSRLYSSNGVAAELDGSRAGTFSISGFGWNVHPDWSRGRVLFLNGATLSAFTASSFALQGSITVSPAATAGRFELWGKDGIAYRTSTQVILVRSPLIGG